MKWKSAKLGEITQVISGTTPESSNPIYWGGSHVWVTPTDLGKLDGWEIQDSDRHLTDAGIVSSKLRLVPARSVVMSSRAPIGHLAIAGVPLFTNQGCKSFVCSKSIDPEFLFLILRGQMSEIQALGSGATFVEVSKSALENFEIRFPDDIEEQRRIAVRLKAQFAAVAEARSAAEVQASDARKLIPAILKAAFEEVTDAEMVRIGDKAQTTSGTTPSRSRKDYWEPPKYPWVKTGEVTFTPIHSTEEYVSEKALSECSLSLLPPGTVLIAMYGQGKTRGQSAVLEVEATTNQACFAILPNETFEVDYLQFWLRHSYETLRTVSEARGGNQSNLNGSLLNAFEVPLVSRERQQAIAKHIRQTIAEAVALQAGIHEQLKEIELLPARLLAQAFEETEYA